MRALVSHDRLLELFEYDPKTGDFSRRKPREAKHEGKTGSINCNGYLRTSVDGRDYLVHRLAWFYFYGEWPSGDLDHKDMNKLNNAIDNLRVATNGQNTYNRGVIKCNSSGYKGVSPYRREGLWVAFIGHNKKNIYLGIFDSPELAAEAYKQAALKYAGEFARFE